MNSEIGTYQKLQDNPQMENGVLSYLNEAAYGDMKDLILELKNQGKTVLMCSHLLADVQDVCDRIAILYGGELKVMGRVDQLLKAQDETQIRTSKLSDTAIKDVEAVLKKHGANVLKIDQPTANLEDLFLKTVEESRDRPGHRLIQEGTPVS